MQRSRHKRQIKAGRRAYDWLGAALTEISSHLQNELSDADWTTKREIIRALVQRIEIGQKKVAVVLRPPTDTSGRVLDPIMVTLSRA